MQDELAAGVRAARAGDLSAMAAVIGASLAYGVAHAVGPGHGKILIAGAAVASDRTAARMAGLGLAASAMQGVTAILLVYGGLGLFALVGRSAVGLAEETLAPLSYALMALVGLWIMLRGWRAWPRIAPADDHARDQDHVCGPGCRHAPSAAEAAAVEGWRDAAALILSIGARPCSGALILLVIAWRFELYALGAAGAMAMALGTGSVVAGVGFFARRLSSLALGGGGATAARLRALAMIGAGGFVAALSGLGVYASL